MFSDSVTVPPSAISGKLSSQSIRPNIVMEAEPKWDTVYCISFFAKPGKHTYMVKYQKQADTKPEVFAYNCNVIKRTEQIPVISKTLKTNVVKREFQLHHSVFAKWIPESASKVRESIESDCTMWKLAKFMKNDQSEIDACKAVVMKHCMLLKEIFINLISVSSFPAITLLDVGYFLTKSKIVEPGFAMGIVDRLFISANFSQPENPKFQIIGNALVRFEFWELLVRIANAKYREAGITKSYSEALSMLITERIIPFAQLDPWQGFRDKELWTIDVNDILEANLDSLKKIFNSNLTSIKKHMEEDDAL